jgi:ribosomal protein L11 methyltransferase
MVYKAFYFSLQPNSIEFIEVLTGLLDFYGFEGINEQGTELIGYIPAENISNDVIEAIKPVLSEMGCKLDWTVKEIAEQNWNSLWESNFDPVIIDTRCVIRAPFHNDFPGATYIITIEPKMSFGTGHHFTTRMMLEKILETDVKGKNILDMGCGTGVLSILASLCGANAVTAIDIDKWSYENTLENIQKNNRKNIQVIMGGKEFIPATYYDIILANINRNILLDQFADYSRSIVRNGMLFISGILFDDVEIIKDIARKEGFNYETDKTLNNWVMLAFRKN